MSLAKTMLIALGVVFGLATVANAAPASRKMSQMNAYTYDIPGKAHQDHFTINN